MQDLIFDWMHIRVKRERQVQQWDEQVHRHVSNSKQMACEVPCKFQKINALA